MKSRYLLWILAFGLTGWAGCSDDSETLVPSDEDEYKTELANGNHDYDVKIKDWHDRTGVYILYAFEPREIYFNGNNAWAEIYRDTTESGERYYTLGDDVYVEGDNVYVLGEKYTLGSSYTPAFSSSTYGAFMRDVFLTGDGRVHIREYVVKIKGTITVEEAEEEYVGQQLAWIEDMFLNLYPDSVLRTAMPLKVVLGKNLTSRYDNLSTREPSYYYSFHNLIFNYGDESIETLAASTKETVKADLHYWFVDSRLKSMISRDEFYAAITYPTTQPAQNKCYELGLLSRTTLKTVDWGNYVKMIIGNTYDKLTAEPANGNFSSTNYTGILHPKKDVNGLIRKKYDIMINDFKRLGVDLQGIGNHQFD